jgi:hypothetical protein
MHIEFQIIGTDNQFNLLADVDGEFHDVGLPTFPTEAMAAEAAMRFAQDQEATYSLFYPLGANAGEC